MSETAAVKEGQVFETVFFANTKKDSAYRFRATHMDGKRAPGGAAADA